MNRCPACSAENPGNSRFCGSCAAPIVAPEAPTAAAPIRSSGSFLSARGAGARFPSGTLIAGRFRIVGLLGRGGMGEVYRADDLKLGMAVALKFLPDGLDRDSVRLERLLNEVRVALKVTHPNVCRVHDIAEYDGQHFLTMEFVDGEDLSSLLKRIGRLPEDKAVQIARELCAGLAAAHDMGILHRDLKPANVMLDGRGVVRITDFGLAGLAEGFSGGELRSGTPGYMAPEQTEGKEVTVRSDLYALGVVLYELFTGKRPFSDPSSATPTSPTSHVAHLDPAVERVILRCLDADPASRPASALAVAAALPGGDPLAAALAAGETPSPELVAQAGGEGALAPRRAIPLLVVALAGFALLAWAVGQVGMLRHAKPQKPTGALVERARQVIERLGFEGDAQDSAFAFDLQGDYLSHIQATDDSSNRWDRLELERPTPFIFWYRESPRPLVPDNDDGVVYFRDPQILLAGMKNVVLDSSGRLVHIRVVPPQYDDSSPEEIAAEPDWSEAFELAGLDFASFEPTTPHWNQESYCATRRAWLGRFSDQPEPELRIEACAYGGRVSYFATIYPWTRPVRQEAFTPSALSRIMDDTRQLLFLAVLIGGALLARRNLRLGRGDRAGAFRVGCFIVVVRMLAWACEAEHLASLSIETALLIRALTEALWDGLFIWLLYLALEPTVRRHWPESIVSWSRLLKGRFRDPLVGRHMLFGAVFGVTLGLLVVVGIQIPAWFGGVPERPQAFDLDVLEGSRQVMGELFWAMRHSVRGPMFVVVILVLARMLVRKNWAAAALLVAVQVLTDLPSGSFMWTQIAISVLAWSVAAWCLIRFGLVAGVVTYFFAMELRAGHPLTLDLDQWYSAATVVPLLLGVALIGYAFYCSLGRQPWFPEPG